MEKSWALAFVSLFTVVFITKIIYYNRYPKRRLPPGPKPWPIIGNLNLIGSIPNHLFHNLSQKYGEIMLLRFGKFPVIVASSPEMAKQFLKVHDTVFASRPELAAGNLTAYNYSDMTWAPYGPNWKQARKIYSSEVFCPKKLETFEKIHVEERRKLFSRLRAQSGKPVVLREELLHLTLSTICRTVFGGKYFSKREEDKFFMKFDELQEIMDEWFFLNGAINIGDWIPWLRFLDLQGYEKRMKDVQKKFDGLFEHVIADHQARRVDNKEQFDIVDVLLQQADNPDPKVPLTRDHIKGLLENLLNGGTDTSTTSIEWAVHELLRQPQIIKKAKDELDRVIGRNRWVEEKDFSQLPYIEAIITELLRLHPAGIVPHYAIEDCEVSGFHVAKGTTVMINTWSIGRDPKTWDAPLDFIPERFVGKVVDMTGSNFALLPFGSGRRRCPGYKLGLKFIRLMVSNLLHGFEWKLVEGMRAEDVSLEELPGLTTHPKYTLSIIMEPTLPSHLY